VIAEHCGQLLLGGFPDRLATKRSGVGQFQLRGGSAAWVAKGDNLAESPFIVAIDLDGDRKNARVRLAASVSVGDIEVACRDRVRKESVLIFDKEKDDFVLRTEVLLDNMRLLSETRRPEASVETLDALIDRVRTTRLAALKLSDEFRRLQRRMQYVRGADGETWPDWTDAALIATLELWLLPYIGQCRDLADMRSMDLVMVLQSGLSWDQSTQFSALAPTEFSLPNGRVRKLEYPADMNPLLRVRVQDLYGVDVHPAIVNGKVPLVLELLSPADRPIQTTSDLPGFWKGSWRDVRKDMAGRYPKHSWPEDPATAKPPK
jgi:ATP-dependent helicase HrpB